jgi:hypothetical protein
MVVAAVCLLLTFLPDRSQIRVGVYRAFGVPTTAPGYDLYKSLDDGVAEMPFLLAILLITVGLLGLYARYGAPAGIAARLALGAGVVGGVAGVVSNLLWDAGHENGRSLMNSSMAVMFAGLFVFGLVALRERPMPRGNGLPALAGFWWPLIVISANVHRQATGQLGPEIPIWLSFTIFSIMSFFLAWLGYVLQSDAPPEPAAA